MSLTTNEVVALKAIVGSEYQDGGNPVDHRVWTECCNPFASKRTLSGVYASLVQKGYITVGDYDGGGGSRKMGTVAITQAGYDMLLNVQDEESAPANPGGDRNARRRARRAAKRAAAKQQIAESGIARLADLLKKECPALVIGDVLVPEQCMEIYVAGERFSISLDS